MINMKSYGFEENIEPVKGIEIARITAVHRERFEVICSKGSTVAVLKSGNYYNPISMEIFPTVGDFVVLKFNANGPSQIIKVLERKSYFSRRDPDVGRGEQLVAANFDYVFILMSLNSDFNPKRLERYLAVAWQSGAVPVIILTKVDLMEGYSEYVSVLSEVAIGVEVIPISTKTGFGLECLNDFIYSEKTIVFLGSSGVGKSTLVNALVGKGVMATSEIRQADDKGCHTTTHRQLIKLEGGAMIIDTPGMRELGMWDITKGLDGAFEDVFEYMSRCKFSNCTHRTEPGCKVIEALKNGKLRQERWTHYLKLKRESRYNEDKRSYLREVRQKGKQNARTIKGLRGK